MRGLFLLFPVSENCNYKIWGARRVFFFPQRRRGWAEYILKEILKGVYVWQRKNSENIPIMWQRAKLEQVVSAQFPCMHYEAVITSRHKCYFLFCRASVPSVEGMVIPYSLCYFLLQHTLPSCLWCQIFGWGNTNIFRGFPRRPSALPV